MFTLGLPSRSVLHHPNFFNGSELVEGFAEIIFCYGFPAHDEEPRVGWIVLFVFFEARMAISVEIARRIWLSISHFYVLEEKVFFFPILSPTFCYPVYTSKGEWNQEIDHGKSSANGCC